MSDALTVGLRVDVDTFRGTRDGVPKLIELFARYDVRATFFMSVGPDNMGRNLWRLLKPAFLLKMLRSNAASLYGWDILLRGTAWPGPIIGDRLRDEVRLPFREGHEVGLHAWDHYTWQTGIDRLSPAQMQQHIQRGFDKLAQINGIAPACSAVAGWRCNEAALLAKEKFNFRYNSDCRGTEIFKPVVGNKVLTTQIPVTLPTYDEIIGSSTRTHGVISNDNFNAYLLSQIQPRQLNVYTVHAEVEGIICAPQFEALLQQARSRSIRFETLGNLVERAQANADAVPQCTMIKHVMAGREGWLAAQSTLVSQNKTAPQGKTAA